MSEQINNISINSVSRLSQKLNNRDFNRVTILSETINKNGIKSVSRLSQQLNNHDNKCQQILRTIKLS